ncbi:TetR/AcrR family transcriptional regulator [Agromyces sp. MMS24-K17]|uniref:TetR/AcrR family transcriptional regulator n=1 Tax=Agromyces sp. MMS24-K17 TaxID=3372850 RepID=UPI003754A48C
MARRGSYAKGIAKREEILATALDVIARTGYGRASVRELADAVGLSQAGLLHYFSSKEELFAEILRKRDEVDEALIADAVRTASGSADADGGMPVEGFMETIRHNAEVPGLVQLYTRLSAEATDAEHPAHPYFVERYRDLRAIAAENLRERREAGEFVADLDADRAATMLIALADGLQTQWLMDPSIDMAAHIEAFLALLGRPAPATPEPAPPAAAPAPPAP